MDCVTSCVQTVPMCITLYKADSATTSARVTSHVRLARIASIHPQLIANKSGNTITEERWGRVVLVGEDQNYICKTLLFE
jgi:hypothetical protein